MTYLETSAFTEERLQNMRQHTRQYQASCLDARARAIETATRRNFVELGLIALHVEELELWRELCDDDGVAYHSMEQWLTTACPFSRSHAFDAKAQVKILRDNKVPIEIAQNIPRANLKQLTQLSSQIMRDPEVLKQAATLSSNDFNATIREKHPDQHIEERTPMRFFPVASQRKIIDMALEMARDLEEAMTREECLENLAITYMETNRLEWEQKHPEAVKA